MDTLSRTPHLKLQEMCDCYLETDFSKQLAAMGSSGSTDLIENSFKYLALALLQATTQQAGELSFIKTEDSIAVTVKTADQTIPLPSPAPELIKAITAIIRSITHLDEKKGESPLILGLKNGQLDLMVEIEEGKKKEQLIIIFPDSESKVLSEKEPAVPVEGTTAAEPSHWKCGKCSFTFTASSLPEQCPGCGEKCDFLNITCYTPECGGPGNIDHRLA